MSSADTSARDPSATDPSAADLRAKERVHGHRRLVKLLRLAYSAERAAAYAYIGHAGSVKDPTQKAALTKIEAEEWGHRTAVLEILRTYDIPISRILEVRFFLIGKVISASCYLIGWFMPYYFAGRLESGNVCEYFIMQQYFHDLGITDHDKALYEMGITEKEHEQFFLDGITNKRLLPIFQRVFAWGSAASYNDVDLAAPHDAALSSQYCQQVDDTSNRARPSRRLRTLTS